MRVRKPLIMVQSHLHCHFFFETARLKVGQFKNLIEIKQRENIRAKAFVIRRKTAVVEVKGIVFHNLLSLLIEYLIQVGVKT